jgi:predicted HicB family RNase H-like nuclease
VTMIISYKGYQARISVDEELKTFSGRVANVDDVLTFEGKSYDELHDAFVEAIEDYLEWCVESGEEPDRPYSGNVLVRMEPSLHRTLARAAAARDESLNLFVVSVLKEAVSEQEGSGLRQRRGRATEGTISKEWSWLSDAIGKISAIEANVQYDFSRLGGADESSLTGYDTFN